jgi:hypothetical protein
LRDPRQAAPRPTPDHPQTNTGPCPIIHGPFPPFWNWETRPPRAYHFVSFLYFVVSNAVFRLSLPAPPLASAGPRNINQAGPQATPKPHQCEIKATPMRVDSQAVATLKPPQSHLKATPMRPQCDPKAPTRLQQSHPREKADGRKAAFPGLGHLGKQVSAGWHSAAGSGLPALPCMSGFRELDAALLGLST